MRYAQARHQSRQRDLAYRIFVTDGIRILTENTANFAGGKLMNNRFYDMLKPKKSDNRTGEMIVADVLSRIGVKVI